MVCMAGDSHVAGKPKRDVNAALKLYEKHYVENDFERIDLR